MNSTQPITYHTMRLPLILLALVLLTLEMTYAQSFQYAKQIYSDNSVEVLWVSTDAAGNNYLTGYFRGEIDLDPGSGTANFNSAYQYSDDIFIVKLDASGNYVWGHTFGDNSEDRGESVTVDASGNVYVTGSFRGLVDFDPGIGEDEIWSGTNVSAFILKLDANGDYVWGKAIEGGGITTGKGIAVDANANVFLGGYASGTNDFDPGTGVQNVTAVAGFFDAFIMKLDASGNLSWVHNFGSTGDDRAYVLQTDQAGDLLVTGIFSETVDLDPGSATQNFTSNGWSDVYLMKLTNGGSLEWVKVFGGTDIDVPKDLAINSNDEIVVGGLFYGTVDFDPGAGVANRSSVNASMDGFTLKLDAQGSFDWVTQIGGANTDVILGVALDDLGYVYSSGSFSGTVDFDPGPAILNYTSSVNSDLAFVQKLSPNGAHTWSAPIGSFVSNDLARNIVIDPSRTLHIAGQFWGTVDFNPGSGTFNMTHQSISDDIFLLVMNQCNAQSLEVIEACDSYTWSANGETYTTSGSHIQYTFSGNNCDSIAELDLTIHESKITFDTVTACFEFPWEGSVNALDSSGDYHDTLYTVHGCDSVVFLNLTIKTVDDSVYQEDSVLTAQADSATFQWLDCLDDYIELAAQTNPWLDWTLGTWAVEITQNGCVDTSACFEFALGIQEHENDLFWVFPNPSSGTIQIIHPSMQKEALLEVFNPQGKCVHSSVFLDGDTSINLEHQAKGLYFIRLTAADQSYCKKFVLE